MRTAGKAAFVVTWLVMAAGHVAGWRMAARVMAEWEADEDRWTAGKSVD